MLVEKALQSWHLLETLTPSELPKLTDTMEKKFLKDNKKIPKIGPLDTDKLPWENIEEIGVEEKYKNNIEFTVYSHIHRKYEMLQIFRSYYQIEDEIINKDMSRLFGCSYKVDKEGQYIKDSLFIPQVIYVLSQMEKGGSIDYKNLSEKYHFLIEKLSEEANRLFLNGVNDSSYAEFKLCLGEYLILLGGDRQPYVEVNIWKDKQEESMNFTSFYIKDIETILTEKSYNRSLEQFIKGTDKKIDIDENKAYLEDVLQPKNLPIARWPSPIKFRLSLMQQVAVNQIVNNDQPINSVNGPPGTGKTTLLKDAIANIVVNRAVQMTTFADPTKAFEAVGKINLNGFPYTSYHLDEKLQNHSIVVASSNNGAVENISKELPERDQIIREIDPEDTYKEYENSYKVEMESLNLFSKASSLLKNNGKEINENENWGLFSAALGRGPNIDNYAWSLFTSKANIGNVPFIKELEEYNQSLDSDAWENAVKEFNDLLTKINRKKDDLQKFHDDFYNCQNKFTEKADLEDIMESIKKSTEELQLKIESLQVDKNTVDKKLELLPKESILRRLIGKESPKKVELKGEKLHIIEEIERLAKEKDRLVSDAKERNNQLALIIGDLKLYEKSLDKYQQQNITLPNEQYWAKENYDQRQKNTPWLTDDLLFERGLLFIKALNIHKIFNAINHKPLKSMLSILVNRKSVDMNIKENLHLLDHMWQTIHLITPVTSTTFASLGSMFKGIGKDSIGYLFIDEAGQASPQQAVGAIWRANRVVAVGDPIQIEPVVTTDQTILSDIRKQFDVDEKFVGLSASVQVLADHANSYGMYKEKEWIGTPLWVHRRCMNLMFNIANKIAYNSKMVNAEDGAGKGDWFDIKGKTKKDQYVAEQGEYVAKKMVEYWGKSSAGKLPNVYIITPFSAVKNETMKIVKKSLIGAGFNKKTVEDWVKKSIGTVHTFQGKEANIVYFICGTDDQSDGAAQWSCSKPNLINVAVTRAKKEFYIVGDRKRFKEKDYYGTIDSELLKL